MPCPLSHLRNQILVPPAFRFSNYMTAYLICALTINDRRQFLSRGLHSFFSVDMLASALKNRSIRARSVLFCSSLTNGTKQPVAHLSHSCCLTLFRARISLDSSPTISHQPTPQPPKTKQKKQYIQVVHKTMESGSARYKGEKRISRRAPHGIMTQGRQGQAANEPY